MLHMAQPLIDDDGLLLTFAELSERPRYTGDEKRKLGRFRLAIELVRPDVMEGTVFSLANTVAALMPSPHDEPTPADLDAAASEPLLGIVEVFVAPDDSYFATDLDPDCYGYGVAATEAETMTAPFDWDAMTEGAAA